MPPGTEKEVHPRTEKEMLLKQRERCPLQQREEVPLGTWGICPSKTGEMCASLSASSSRPARRGSCGIERQVSHKDVINLGSPPPSTAAYHPPPSPTPTQLCLALPYLPAQPSLALVSCPHHCPISPFTPVQAYLRVYPILPCHQYCLVCPHFYPSLLLSISCSALISVLLALISALQCPHLSLALASP